MRQTNEKLSPEQLRAAEMILARRQTGETFADIASHFNISERQLYRWRELPAFKEYLRRRALDIASESLGLVMSTLTEKAIAGNNKSIELYLKSLGVWNERQYLDVTARQAQPEDRSTEALEASLDELRRQLEDIGGGSYE
jgi:transposase-like protein